MEGSKLARVRPYILLLALAFLLRYFLVDRPAGQDWAAYLFAASKIPELFIPVNFAYEPELFPLIFYLFLFVGDFDFVASLVYFLLAASIYRYSGDFYISLVVVFNPYVFRLSLDFLKETLAFALIFLYLSGFRHVSPVLPLVHHVGLAFTPFTLVSRDLSSRVRVLALVSTVASGVYVISMTGELYLVPSAILLLALILFHRINGVRGRPELYFPAVISLIVALHILSQYPYRFFFVVPLTLVFIPKLGILSRKQNIYSRFIPLASAFLIMSSVFYVYGFVELPFVGRVSSLSFTSYEYSLVDSLKVDDGVVLSNEKLCKLISYRWGLRCVTADMLDRGLVEAGDVKAIVVEGRVIYLD